MSASTRWVTPTAGLATIFGIATLYSGGRYAVCDEQGARLEPAAFLLKR